MAELRGTEKVNQHGESRVAALHDRAAAPFVDISIHKQAVNL